MLTGHKRKNNLNNKLAKQKSYQEFSEKFGIATCEKNMRDTTIVQRLNRIGCRFTGPYMFWKLTGVPFYIFNNRRPIVRRVLGLELGNYNNNTSNSKLKLYVLNQNKIHLLDGKVSLCTLFFKYNTYGWQRYHTFTLDLRGKSTVTIHHSWKDDEIRASYNTLSFRVTKSVFLYEFIIPLLSGRNKTAVRFLIQKWNKKDNKLNNSLNKLPPESALRFLQFTPLA